MDLSSIRYEVEDYIDVLKNQLSADVFKETKKAVYLSSAGAQFAGFLEKSRNLKALVKLYENVALAARPHCIGPARAAFRRIHVPGGNRR